MLIKFDKVSSLQSIQRNIHADRILYYAHKITSYRRRERENGRRETRMKILKVKVVSSFLKITSEPENRDKGATILTILYNGARKNIYSPGNVFLRVRLLAVFKTVALVRAPRFFKCCQYKLLNDGSTYEPLVKLIPILERGRTSFFNYYII